MRRFPFWYKIKHLEFHNELQICVLTMSKKLFGFITFDDIRLVRHIKDNVEYKIKGYSSYHEYTDGIEWDDFSEKYNATPFSKYKVKSSVVNGFHSTAQVIMWYHEAIFNSPAHKRKFNIRKLLDDSVTYKLF